MTIEHAALLTRHLGTLSAATCEPQSAVATTSELFDVLTRGVFNAFWDEGIQELA